MDYWRDLWIMRSYKPIAFAMARPIHSVTVPAGIRKVRSATA